MSKSVDNIRLPHAELGNGISFVSENECLDPLQLRQCIKLIQTVYVIRIKLIFLQVDSYA